MKIDYVKPQQKSNKWKIEVPSKPIVSRGWHITDNDDSTVAVILGENFSAQTGVHARLISAAPDMLSALEIIKENLEAMQPMIELKTEFDKIVYKSTLDACNAALRKATSL